MKIVSCYIEGFGKIAKRNFTFRDGINEYPWENGCGKTTLCAFISAMFYGMESIRKNTREFMPRKHFYPFAGGKCGGNMTIEKEDGTYRIERFFDRESEKKDTLNIYDGHGNPVTPPAEGIGRWIFGIGKGAFERSIFLNADTMSTESDSDINEKLGNLVSNTDSEYNCKNATEGLEKRIRELGISRKGGKISELKEKIREKEQNIRAIRNSQNSLNEKYNDRENIKKELDKCDDLIKKAIERQGTAQALANYENALADAERKKEKADEILSRFPDGIPDKSELEYACKAEDEIEKLKGELSLYALGNDEKELSELSERFSSGYPDTTRLTEIKKKKNRANEIRATVSASQINGIYTYDESETADAKPLYNTERSENVKRYAKVRLILISSAILFAAGIALSCLRSVIGTASIAVGIFCMLAGIVGVCVGMYEKNTVGRKTKELETRRVVELAHKKAMEAQKERQKELSDELSDICGELSSFFERYKIFDENFDDAYLHLTHDVEKYNRLKDICGRKNDKRKEISERIEKREGEIATLLLRYYPNNNDDNRIRESAEVLGILRKAREEYDNALFEYGYAREQAVKMKPTDSDNEQESAEERKDADISELNRRKNELTEDMARLRAEIRDIEKYCDTLTENEEELGRLSEEREDLELQGDILTKTIRYLSLAQEKISDKYMAPIKERFCHYIGRIKAEPFTSASIRPSLGVNFMTGGETYADMHLSTGEMCLCALCQKLALIDVMYSGSERPVIVLDDPFVTLDERHFEIALNIIKDLSDTTQIIYLYCHNSRKIADKAKIYNV